MLIDHIKIVEQGEMLLDIAEKARKAGNYKQMQVALKEYIRTQIPESQRLIKRGMPMV